MAKRSAQQPPEFSNERRLFVFLRVTALTILTTIGCLAVIAFTVSHWLEDHILNTDAWVATVGPMPSQPVVNTALSSYITSLVFANVNVEQEIEHALPPRASFIAGPLASQVHNVITQITKRVLASDRFETVWSSANRLAMNRLLTNARSPNQPRSSKLSDRFNINLSGIKTTLTNRLGSTANAVPALQSKSGPSFKIGANLQANRERLWHYIKTADFMNVVLPFVIFAAFLGALALSHNRRRVLLASSVGIIILLLLEQIGIKALRQDVLDQVKNASYHQAVGYIYDTVTAGLRSFVYILLMPAIVIIIICLITSPTEWASQFRQRATDKLSFIRTMLSLWHTVRSYTWRHRFVAWGAIGILLLAWLAFISDITTVTVVKDVLIALVLAELIYITAHPHLSHAM